MFSSQKPQVARFYCAYCMRNQPGTSRRKFEGNGGCSHEFCRACLEDYLFQRITVGHHSLHPCPKFGEESCRSSATRNDVRRIVRAEVYEEHRRRLEGLSGACEECGHRGRRPSSPSSPSSPHVSSPPSPLLSSLSRRASTAAADSHEEDADAGAKEENTCQSCGSTRRRHHHQHHQSHRQKHHSVPRDAAAAGAAGRAPGGGAGRKGRKGFAWSPSWSPHRRGTPSLDGTATGGDDESGQRRNKRPDKRQQQEQQQKRRGLSPEAAAASASDPPESDEKRATGAGAGGEETEGAASAAGTHAAGLRHRTCPTCGAHMCQRPCGSGVKAPVDPNDEAMTTTTMPTLTAAAASETATARRRRGSDMTDNLVPCLGCGEAWCLLCGDPVSTAKIAADVVSSGVVGGGYRRTRTDPKEGRGRDGAGEKERGTGHAVSTGGVVPRGHVRHFNRWNVAGCPGARFTDPKGWEGEFITLYRALVAILVFLVGPLFFLLRGVCLLVETLLAPLCCGAFGGASRSVPGIICFPLAVTLSAVLMAAWLPLGLVAAAARWLWTAAAFGRPQADEDVDGGGGGGQFDSDVPALRQPEIFPVSKKQRQTTEKAKACRILAFAPAVMLSSYLASWWREGGDGGRGRGGGSHDDGGVDDINNNCPDDERSEKQWQNEDLSDEGSEKARELLVVAAEEGAGKGELETPPLSFPPARP
ncbi:unnamed protein product [Ectocarpus sp. 12 AP-2014]